MNLAVSNPNLSVILPVGCNAKCEFCYWKKDCGLTVEKFENIAVTLPSIFTQCSITGGEPTLLSNLTEYLKTAKNRFDKVVLNTNGCLLTLEHIKVVDYVNISRHHYLDDKNRKVFGTETVPSVGKLKILCSYGNITLNCFLPEGFSDKQFINDYIEFAKYMGAKVAFRKYYNNLNILTEIDTDKTLVMEHFCGACRHRIHIINDCNVTFKYSVKETSEHVNGIYELILHPNGNLAYDWAGKYILTYQGD